MVSNAYYNEIIQLFMRNWMPFSLFPYISLEFSDYSLQGDYSKNYCYRTHERYRLKFRNYIKFPENVHFHHQPSSHFCVRVFSLTEEDPTLRRFFTRIVYRKQQQVMICIEQTMRSESELFVINGSTNGCLQC